jgi:hypothetical protein
MGVRVYLLDGSHVDYPRAHGATEASSGNLVVWRAGPHGCTDPVDEVARGRWASWWATWTPRTEPDPTAPE